MANRVRERRTHVDDVPDTCVCGSCNRTVFIDWANVQEFENGGFLVQQPCECGVNVVNAIGNKTFVDFVQQNLYGLLR